MKISIISVIFFAIGSQAISRRLCGVRLYKAIDVVCTWEGEDFPCTHSSAHLPYYSDSSELESTRRRKPHHEAPRRNRESIVRQCCQSKCDEKTLAMLCCTEREARAFYSEPKGNFNMFYERD